MFSRFPVAFRRPAFASWAILCPLRRSAFLTVSAPDDVAAARTSTELPCSARARHDRGGCPLYPGTGGVLWPGLGPPTSACRIPAAGPAPCWNIPPAGLIITRHHRGFTHVHPSGLPLRLWPPDGTDALGLDHPSFAPRRYRQRTSGWGQAIEH